MKLKLIILSFLFCSLCLFSYSQTMEQKNIISPSEYITKFTFDTKCYFKNDSLKYVEVTYYNIKDTDLLVYCFTQIYQDNQIKSDGVVYTITFKDFYIIIKKRNNNVFLTYVY